MSIRKYSILYAVGILVMASSAFSQVVEGQPKPPVNPKYDAELARKLGADDLGMRSYILVLLKSSSKPVPAGKERNEMFAGHMANMKRLAAEGKLVLAGPLDGVDGMRGLFVFALDSIEEAKKLTETDPVIVKGEMVAVYHKYFGNAGIMMLNEIYEKIAKNPL
ncbi:MAG: hypothetical protein IPM50_01315 [Acidobacteriota bacterium]|nr:MAG: hypothetical protein IPM50_01315 [Acidobacteriota bacterium]